MTQTTDAPQTVGFSVRKRPIDLWRFGPLDDKAPLEVLFIGVFHGDEGISGELLQAFTRLLAAGEALDPAIPVGILPVLNPDGLAAGSRGNANGVDLNRNYPTRNWRAAFEDLLYHPGPSPASEPETRLVIDLLDRTRPRRIVTVHAPYRVLNYDGPGRPLAEAMARCNGYPVVADIGYPTPGSFGTYAGVERGIPLVTLELPEDEPVEAVWDQNREALLTAIQAPLGERIP